MIFIKSGATNSDISFMYHDPILDSLRNYKTKQDARYTELHQTSELIKRDISHLMLSLDSPAQRFIDECLIPVMTLASLIPGPQQVVTVPATALACAVRAVPMLGRAATAFGAEYVFNKAVESLKEKAGKSGQGNERIQSTRQDADGYLKGITDQKNVLNYKGKTLDNHEYYEFIEKCEYKGVQFRKGDYISRDTQHHEWEWFRGKDVHKGPINSLNGEVNLRKVDTGRTLKIK